MSSSTPSSSSSSPQRITSSKAFLNLSRHTLKQLKFVLPGGAVTYLLGTLARFWQLVEEETGWARVYARTTLVCGLLTVGLFLYILLVPWLKGAQPNYSQWRQSGELSFVVPTLTALMALGWPLLSYTLSHWTDLGFLKGVVASSGLYALVFGLLGLVPAPKMRRR
ncbi:uncharacterized protein FOMMEDRAFT_17095 [Fomitiporia mediterranea MF3/22]|uniref:uncharacterized protein n=1 Tax=Fomitiporia mediterranea (strain MF3/22) TaxID=694068 RepID=UPI00044089FF|nr:uncharacterized protein FOMMEDRAFT_17095 [Fomitiporia mediterranea MF3/22]EJD06585.1 hypothetical protein FOMMEDRAFT_17095 [Fomitiporia mediterranea MF3/22]